MGILEIAIVGAILAGIIQFLKNKFGTEGWQTKVLTVLLALIVGAGIYFFQNTSYWETVMGVLTAASTVWAFFLKK